jgi:hypothetical protein
VPYTFGGDYQPELGAQSFEGAGYTGGYDLPNFTAKGALDPRDQAQMAQSTTFAKNREGLLADNVFSAQAGPGAYAAGSFDPTITYKGSIVDFPGERTLMAMAQTGGWQGAVAQRMLKGMSSSQAMGEIRALIEADPKGLDKDAAALQTQIFQSLNAAKTSGAGGNAVDQFILEGGGASGDLAAAKTPAKPGPGFDWSQYDLPGMQQWADDRQMDLLKDQPKDQLFQDPKSGAYYNQAPEETPSAQAKWFADRGLTTPDKSYADQAYQEEVLNRNDPGRQMGIQQDQLSAQQGQATQQALSQRQHQLEQTAQLFEQELRKQQQGLADFVPRQQAQNAPLPPQPIPQRGGVSAGAGRKTAGSMPPDLEQASTVVANGSAPTIPRNVQGEPITPGPKDWTGAPLPSEQDLTDYYLKTFPTAPMQVNTQTTAAAPVFDFGAGAKGNSQISDFISALAQSQGVTKPIQLNSGGQKGSVIPGSRSVRPDEKNAAAIRGQAQKAQQMWNNQYDQDWAQLYSGGDFGRTYLQRGQMDQMAARGRTPLNDELMQRRLLINALGLYQ